MEDFHRMSVEEVATLWKKTSSSPRRERVAIQLLQMTKPIRAHQISRVSLAGCSLEREDLEVVAKAELFVTADRFDPGLGYVFGTYYTANLIGVFKKLTSASRDRLLSRSAKESLSKVLTAANELESRLFRKPTFEEISERSGVTVDLVNEVLLAPRVIPFSQVSSGGEDGDDGAEDRVYEQVEAADDGNFDVFVDREVMLSLIASLPYPSDVIVYMRHYEDLTKKEISEQTEYEYKQIPFLLKRGEKQLMRLILQRMKEGNS